jgi:homoserine kinase type II
MECHSELNDERLSEMVCGIMENHYDLGKMTRVKEVLGGYCNKSYAVWMSVNDRVRRYFLRLYNPNVIEKEILFEHALLNHLRSNGFTLAAAIIPGRNGTTLVHTPAPEGHPGSTALWALFDFLEGEDKYSWTHTDLTDKEFISAAEILAHLHHCGYGFKKPPGADRAQPRIMPFIATFKETFSAFLQRTQDRRCDGLFKSNFEPICKALDDAVSHDVSFRGMPELPIHCDYHPGNLKYRDEKGVGIFDFDWSKIDYRLFDVALGLVYFTSIWDTQQAGLRHDKLTLFLSTYYAACHDLAHIDPLIKQEQRNLVPMLSIANLYVLNWDLVDFYETSQPDDTEYFAFIDHNIGLMHWLVRHEDELGLWVKESFE